MAKGGLKNFFGQITQADLSDAKSKIIDITKETFKLKKISEQISEEIELWNEEYNDLISSLGIARTALKSVRDMQLASVKSLAFYGVGIKEVNASTTALA